MTISRRMIVVFKIGICVALLAAIVMFFIANNEGKVKVTSKNGRQPELDLKNSGKIKDEKDTKGQYDDIHQVDFEVLQRQLETEHTSSVNNDVKVIKDKKTEPERLENGKMDNQMAPPVAPHEHGKSNVEKVVAPPGQVDNQKEKVVAPTGQKDNQKEKVMAPTGQIDNQKAPPVAPHEQDKNDKEKVVPPIGQIGKEQVVAGKGHAKVRHGTQRKEKKKGEEDFDKAEEESLDQDAQEDYSEDLKEAKPRKKPLPLVKEPEEKFQREGRITKMHLAVVACGDHLETTIVLIKSAVLLSRGYFIVHIYTEEELKPQFHTQLRSWPAEIRKKFHWKLYDIQFPEKEHSAVEWKKLFKTCASQRLFFPDLMPELDALLYVDTDILFMRPIDDIWEHFTKFNSTHIAALAPEHESPNAGWYNRFARHPYYGPLGVNSGVMLMNLTRMRQAKWLEHIVPYYKEYKLRITWGDQDLINIFFHYFPHMLYVYDCDWNYRPDHCMYMSVCKQAETNGVSVLHGCRSVYHNEKQPAFKAIYQAFREHRFQDSLTSSLIPVMEENLNPTKTTPCGRLANIYTYQLKQQVQLALGTGKL